MKEVTRWTVIVLSLLIICVLSFYIWKIFFCCTYTTERQPERCFNVDITLNKVDYDFSTNTVKATITKGGNRIIIKKIMILVYDSNKTVLCNGDDFDDLPDKKEVGEITLVCSGESALKPGIYTVKIAPMIGEMNQCEPVDKMELIITSQ
ncbi:MAG: hypothetical protein WC867_04375 [Candidatus Pacearchaeota archaeon]|jgi:hypothetical protein